MRSIGHSFSGIFRQGVAEDLVSGLWWNNAIKRADGLRVDVHSKQTLMKRGLFFCHTDDGGTFSLCLVYG